MPRVNSHSQYCAAINCSNSRAKNPELAFFTFPKSGKRTDVSNIERCKTWWVNTRRCDLDFKKDFDRIMQLALCECHFTASQFMNPNDKGVPKPRKQLRKDAIPTLFDIPNPPKTSDAQRPTTSIEKRKASEVHGPTTKRLKGTDEGIPIESMAHDFKSEAVFIKEEEIFIKEEELCIKEEPTESMETGSANGVKFGDEDRIIKDEIDFNNDESQHLNIFNDPILLPINEKESESPTPAAASHSDKRDDFDRAAAPISSTSTGGTTGPKHNDVKSPLPPSKRSTSNRGGVEPNDVLAAVMEQLKSMSSQEKTNDEATDFGVVVANSLRQMTNKNKIYSQKLIHDIICLGRLDRLSASTKIVE